jgi:hypothetical protein
VQSVASLGEDDRRLDLEVVTDPLCLARVGEQRSKPRRRSVASGREKRERIMHDV